MGGYPEQKGSMNTDGPKEVKSKKKNYILMLPSGKLAVFKAKVKGDPKPEVSWRRTKGLISDKDKFLYKYDKSTGEHILEVSGEWTVSE